MNQNKIVLLVILTLLSFGIWSASPSTMVVQARVFVNGVSNYTGTLDMIIGIYHPDNDTDSLWSEKQSRIPITNGQFSTVIGQTNPIDPAIFDNLDLRIGFAPYQNNQPLAPTFIDLKSTPYAFHSERANYANRLANESLLKLDETNLRVGINTEDPAYTLDVNGTVNATEFIGDGSQLTNIQISDERLVWSQSDTPGDIYYDGGNVGINTDTPSAFLEVSGNAVISGNLTVLGTLNATYLKGDGSFITNLNANELSSGTLHSDRLVGDYPNITGLGTITSGTWQATRIDNAYIDPTLTLDGATLKGENFVSGNITLLGSTIITGNHTLAIESPSWNIEADGRLTVASLRVGKTTLSTNGIHSESSNGFSISTGESIVFLSPTGSIGINTRAPAAEFHVNGGLLLGDSAVESNGMIRFKANQFQGFRNNEWVQLDYVADFDPHALHAEGDKTKNVVYVTSKGNVGIGGISPDNITDHLTTSGNVVFKGYSLGSELPDLSVRGTGTRLIWYPKKTAFRAGFADTDEWDDANIGINSVVFGHSGKADAENTTIIGGQSNTNSGKSSVIVGGSSNTIRDGVTFSTIIGGGSSSEGGNTIESGNFSTIVSGHSNTIRGNYATILGGSNNTVNADYSVAMGSNITIAHPGTIIFSDGQEKRESTSPFQFLIFAEGNVGINRLPQPDVTLSVYGPVEATYFIGDGSQLTNISAIQLDGHSTSLHSTPGHIYVSDNEGYLPEGSVSGLSIKDESITAADIQNESISGDKLVPYAITRSKIQDGAITAEKIANDAITTEKIQNNAITSEHIRDGSIVSKNIADNAVTTRHIVNKAVTNEKLALNTIDSSRIVDESITSSDIAVGAITSVNIAVNAIQSHHIASETVGPDNIANNAIQMQHISERAIENRHLADGSVDTTHIVNESITSEHIAPNAIQGIHIDDATITNDRIADNSIVSAKIAENAIEGTHLPDNIIEARHVSDSAIVERHIASGTIDGTRLADNAIVPANIADKAITSDKLALTAPLITSEHIIDGTITSADLADGAIEAINIADNSIGGDAIALNSLSGSHIQENAITSDKIEDLSITADDIADDAIDAAIAVAVGTITSDKILDGTIKNEDIANDAIDSRLIADGSIPWEKLTTDPLPVDRIAPNSIPGTALQDGSIDGSKITDESITSDKLADGSISVNALDGVLSVDKGGTGLTNLDGLANAILYGKSLTIGETIIAGDSSYMYWDDTNHFMGINTKNPLATLHVKGNILTENGGVYFGNLSQSISFGENDNGEGFIIIGPNLDATSPTVTAATDPLGTLKAKKIYVSDQLGIGTSDPKNSLDIGGENASMAIGSGFAGQKRAPNNGLIVEGFVGIGTAEPQSQLDVNGSIYAKTIVGTSTDPDGGIGIHGIGGAIGIQSLGAQTGITVNASQIGIRAESDEIGIQSTITNVTSPSKGVHATLKNGDTTLVEGVVGYLENGIAASIYGTSQSSNDGNWAGYFDGPVFLSDKLGIGLRADESPQAALHVKGNSIIEGPIYTSYGTLEASSTPIDWNAQSKYHISNCRTENNVTFTDPENDGMYVFTILVTSTNDACKITFPDTVKWEKGIKPGTLPTKTHAFSLLAHVHDTGTDYYAIGPVEF
jgi:hypothetical protein